MHFWILLLLQGLYLILWEIGGIHKLRCNFFREFWPPPLRWKNHIISLCSIVCYNLANPFPLLVNIVYDRSPIPFETWVILVSCNEKQALSIYFFAMTLFQLGDHTDGETLIVIDFQALLIPKELWCFSTPTFFVVK